MNERCGIFAVYSKGRKVAREIFTGLLSLQHRGQESAGIATCDDGRIYLKKNMGLVQEIFRHGVDELKGSIGIGHVRYSTTGASAVENAQPVFTALPDVDIVAAFNGNIANYWQLRKELQNEGATFVTESEMELVGKLYAKERRRSKSPFKIARGLMEKLDGSYSLGIITSEEELIIIRDPMGIKPLVFGKKGEDYYFSSESCALDAVGVKFIRDVFPGEVIHIKEGRMRARRIVEKRKRAHCMFEFVYFARGDSVIEGRPVYEVRERLGEKLARIYPVDADVVVPVPDSGRSYAAGYSRASGIPYREGLMKNRYVFRTFILPEQKQRDWAVRIKMNPVKRVLKGKRVVLIDDSLVRGTTLKKIVRLVKRAGAKEVHLRIGCPPIIAPCYMGIDFPTYEELAASNRTVEEIRKMVGADSIGYMTLDGLFEAIGIGKDGLCTACLTEEYPLKIKVKRGRAHGKK